MTTGSGLVRAAQGAGPRAPSPSPFGVAWPLTSMRTMPCDSPFLIRFEALVPRLVAPILPPSPIMIAVSTALLPLPFGPTMKLMLDPRGTFSSLVHRSRTNAHRPGVERVSLESAQATTFPDMCLCDSLKGAGKLREARGGVSRSGCRRTHFRTATGWRWGVPLGWDSGRDTGIPSPAQVGTRGWTGLERPGGV